MKILRQMYFDIIGERCGHKAVTVAEKAKRDFWLSAAEAKEYGLVDDVLTKALGSEEEEKD